MIIEPPYMSDREIYHKLPLEDRWIMNKLLLAEQLGYSCGPTGMIVPEGDYCVRPIMNLYGQGAGGFFKVTVPSGATRNFINVPGYFWCEWFDGDHIWTQYIDDVPVVYSENPVIGDVMSSTIRTADPTEVALRAPPLPNFLRLRSKYMMTESIGDKIIEVSARMMILNAHQFIIDDYKQIDPAYTPVEGTDFDFGNSDLRRIPLTWNTGDGTLTGWKWDPVAINRRP